MMGKALNVTMTLWYDVIVYIGMMYKSIFCIFSYFHVLLLYWLSYFPHIGPHIAHSSGNMLLKVLQCCRFWIIMNLNGNLLAENCIVDSGLPFSMDVNFGIIEYCQLLAGIFLARVRQEGQ